MSEHPQLKSLIHEYKAAQAEAESLGKTLPEQWGQRPPSGGWSVAECLIHLNLTSSAFLPHIDRAIRKARRQGLSGQPPYRLGWFARFFLPVLEPPYRMKAKTAAPFQPASVEPPAHVLEEFSRLQAALQERIAGAADLNWNRLHVPSPFSRRLRYNLYDCLRIIVAHQRRHFWQAGQTLKALAEAAGGPPPSGGPEATA